MDTLVNRWKMFFGLILDPWTLVLFVATLLLFYLSTQQASQLVSALIFLLITVTSAVLGGRVSNHWSALTESGALAVRGRVAVRSLKLLLRNTAALEARLRRFRSAEGDIEKLPTVTSRNYEEAIAVCGLLQEETVSSIENWTDIVPEADINSLIGMITQLKASLDEKEEELKLLKSSLEDARGKSESELSSLRRQIKDKEQQLRAAEFELIQKKFGAGLGSLGSLAQVTSGTLGSVLGSPPKHVGMLGIGEVSSVKQVESYKA